MDIGQYIKINIRFVVRGWVAHEGCSVVRDWISEPKGPVLESHSWPGFFLIELIN